MKEMNKEVTVEIKKLMKKGYDKKDITTIICSRGDSDSTFNARVVEEVITNDSSFHLMQKINRSKILQDISSSDDMCYLLDPESKEVTKIKERKITRLYEKNHKQHIIDKIIVANFTYNPNEPKRLYQKDLVWYYNRYLPPSWYESTFYSNGNVVVDVRKEIPPLYGKFFNHLVDGDKKSYDYVLKWLANAVRFRNFCVLTAIGSQGIGKGVLGDIMRELFGKSNYHQGDNRLITKDFNKQFKNKKCVFIDEVRILKPEHVNKFKALINDYIECEGKGENAIEIRNYASIYIASNDFDSIVLTADDRRFSIVNLTSTRLDATMDPDTIGQLSEPKNVEELAKFLWYLPIDKAEMLRVFTSERTEEVRRASTNDWQQYLFDQLAVEMQGTESRLSVITEVIEDKFGSKFKPSSKAMSKLHKIYPDKFSLHYRRGDKGVREWWIKFPKRDTNE